MKVAVFAGPSLPPPDRDVHDAVEYLAPAARGDVLAAARDFDAVLLIDGVFHHDLAPSPKECYAALEHARMWGASSMGALRAAECASYGFTPLGAIANWYRRDVIDGDDEVAVLTHPQTHEALTVPLVNVRHVARLANRRRLITRSEHDTLIERARAIFYMDRTWDDVIDCAREGVREALAAIVHEEGDLKRLDARFALKHLLRSLERGKQRIAPKQIAPTLVTTRARERRETSPIVLPSSVPKAAGTYDRAVPFSRTLELLPVLRERYGITRVADTTLLDRTGIPTYSALVPHSPDLLGVYNGKGLTREAAMASAVMEATERQIGAAVNLPVFHESLRIVGARIDLDVMHARENVRDLTIECVWGTELLSGERIPVPVAMVQCPWYGEKLFDQTTTNGLASGNNLTEAVYHALCELIERHIWAMYHVRCSMVPRLYLGPKAKDLALAPELELPCGDPVIDGLAGEIRASGMIVRVLVLREGNLPVTSIATITEPDSSPPMAHMGLGCALSPAHAVTRALTEAVQSRVVDIQAAREDILRAGEDAGEMGEHGRRLSELPSEQWYYDMPNTRVRLRDLDDRTSDDLAWDLRQTLDALRAYGIPSVVAVDISPPDLPISVVRTIVPGLETLMFSGHMGPKARALLNPFAVSA